MDINCSECGTVWPRPFHSQHLQVQFVCRVCRCADCQAVFDRPCDCGEKHTVRSRVDKKICIACIEIRERVAKLDPELLRLRQEFQDKEESLC